VLKACRLLEDLLLHTGKPFAVSPATDLLDWTPGRFSCIAGQLIVAEFGIIHLLAKILPPAAKLEPHRLHSIARPFSYFVMVCPPTPLRRASSPDSGERLSKKYDIN
jgi:hypothetical protein